MAKKIETPTLETERLVLKPCCLEDCAVLQDYFNNWNVIKHVNGNVPWPYPEKGSEEHYLNVLKPKIEAGKTMVWTIFEKENVDHPIGRIEYRIIKEESDCGDRGFWIAERFWNKGYMTEAITCLNDFVFNELNVKKMSLTNFADNIGSHRVKEKTGATHIKTIQEDWRDEKRDFEIWELTADNWNKFRKGTR